MKPFELGGETIKPGTRKQIDLPVARLAAGSWTAMPIVVIHGRQPGPTAWFSGAIHGDELNGVEIVRRLIRQIKPKKLAGTVLAVPIVNVFGVTNGSRYLPDRRDLNRSFPGSSRGSLAGRIARLFYEQVTLRADFGLDFHTGSNGRSNLPQIRCDMDDEETNAMALRFCPPLILHATLRDGSLRAAARDAGVRVLLYEAGEAHRFDTEAIRIGVDGALRVLCGADMLPDETPPATSPPPVCRDSRWVRAGRTGFAHTLVELGALVQSGEPIAEVVDSTGGAPRAVRAPFNGIVIGMLKTALVHRGDALVHIAETP